MRLADLDNMPPHRAIGSAVAAPRSKQTPQAVPGQPLPGSLATTRMVQDQSGDPARFRDSSVSGHAASLLQMQRQHGNRFVQRVVALAQNPEGEGQVMPDVERAIEGSRRSGHALDSGVKASLGEALNADFSDVRVHTGADADALNRSLSARAFTTGQDIYFRQGEYNPGSAGGRELLAHELTHVVQQNPAVVHPKMDDDGAPSSCACGNAASGPQMKLTVSEPGDLYEQEADRVASAVMQQQTRPEPSQAQAINRQMPEEDRDKLHGKYHDDELRRAVKEDEEQRIP